VWKIIVVMVATVFFACILSNCRTTVPNNGEPATEYREISSTIRDGQAELAATGSQLEQQIASSAADSKQLEQSISNGADTVQRIRDIIQRVRNQPVATGIGIDR